MTMTADNACNVPAYNDAFRKGLCAVEVIIPPGLDELAPMMRLVVGAVFTARRFEFPPDDGSLHYDGVVNVLGKDFRWQIACRGDSCGRVLAVYVPSEFGGS